MLPRCVFLKTKPPQRIARLAAPLPPALHFLPKQNKLAFVPRMKQSARACALLTHASFQIPLSMEEAQCTQDRDGKNKTNQIKLSKVEQGGGKAMGLIQLPKLSLAA